jgi:3-polyprenyl-4-hydroxybenzoate decarboxylase
MTKFRIGPEASLGSNARIIPGSRVAATTGHAIPELERELIARAASIALREPFEPVRLVAALRSTRLSVVAVRNARRDS